MSFVSATCLCVQAVFSSVPLICRIHVCLLNRIVSYTHRGPVIPELLKNQPRSSQILSLRVAGHAQNCSDRNTLICGVGSLSSSETQSSRRDSASRISLFTLGQFLVFAVQSHMVEIGPANADICDRFFTNRLPGSILSEISKKLKCNEMG